MGKKSTRGSPTGDHPGAEILRLKSEDGHEFEAALYPAALPHAPALIFWPALGTHARFYTKFSRAMAARGVHVCTPDWRGIGSSTLRASRSTDFGYRQLVEFDAPRVIDGMRRRYPESPLWLGGHSLGGQLCALVASTHPAEIAGLIAIASGSVYYRTFSPVFQFSILALTVAAPALGGALGYFPGQRLGFGGREARGVMRDWVGVACRGRYQPQGARIDYERQLGKLRKPVLALNFAGDSWAPPKSAKHLLSKMPRGQITHWNWGADETQGVSLDHFSWARQPEYVAPRVAGWLLQNTVTAAISG